MFIFQKGSHLKFKLSAAQLYEVNTHLLCIKHYKGWEYCKNTYLKKELHSLKIELK